MTWHLVPTFGVYRITRLIGLMVLISCHWALAQGPVDAPAADPFAVEFQRIAGGASNGIWVVSRPESTRQPVMGNGVIIVNSDHVVVVDGSGSPLLADRVIGHIRSITPLPVRYLVVTHWHGDHHLGNYRLLQAWPGAQIISHHFTRQAMLGAPMDYLAEVQQSIEAQLESLHGLLQRGEKSDGTPLPDWLARQYQDLVDHSALIVTEIGGSQVTAPGLTFEHMLTLRADGRNIELRHFGPGNTAGDLVAWLPDERILITGDVVVHPTPYGFGSYPRAWSGVLQQLMALQPELVVPGHGPVMQDTGYLARLAGLFEYVAQAAEAAVASGLTLEQFRDGLQWQGYSDEFSGGDAWLDSRFTAWFATPISQAAWNEAAGLDNEPLQRVDTNQNDDSAEQPD